MQNVNIKTIAALAGVSPASVSRALKDSPSSKVSASVRNRILEVCSRLHYYPNEHAKRMFSKKANTIALIFPQVPEVSSTITNMVIDVNLMACIMGVQKILSGAGIDILLNELTPDYLSSQKYLRSVRSKAVDGILIWGAVGNSNYIFDLLNENVPMVMLQNYVYGCNCPHVIPDDYQGMKALVRQIVTAGHRKIGLIGAPDNTTTGATRNNAVYETLSQYGLKLSYEYDKQGYGYDFGREATLAMLERSVDITCLIYPNDITAWGGIDVMNERGLQVPEHMSVCGGDGMRFPGHYSMSSYVSPSYDIGRKSAELLLRLMKGEKVPLQTILPVSVVPGNTIASVNS